MRSEPATFRRLTKLTKGDDMTKEERLAAFEEMLAVILERYETTTEKMTALKAEGREKTVTYKQLFADKLQLQAILSYYRAYGLLDE